MAEVERFDALTRTVGYAAALELLDSLREQVAAALGSGAVVRTTRRHLEISLPAESAERLEADLDRVRAAIASSVDIDGFAFDLALLFGAADPLGAPISDDLVVTAELALVEARRRQRAAVLPHAASAARGGGRFQMLRALQAAIADDRLELHYQPKLRARGGAVEAVEALIRWPQPDGSYIAPDTFIPVAEETGDIRAMTEWVIARAVTDLAALATAGVALRCDVNISAATLADRDFTRALVDRVAATGGLIGFEITETAMIADPARALANLHLCGEAGVRLAIDDYGAGFSSLAYLQQLPFTELKIDRSFVSRLTSHQRDPLLVRSTIDLAHALEMEVTAEGVESPQVLALLQVMGCDLVQGFYLSRPLPLDRLVVYLSDAEKRGPVPDQRVETLRRRVDAARLNG